jgi:hypothetical protein
MSNSSRRPNVDRDRLWGALTMATLGLAVLVIIYFTAVFVSPSLAPFGSQSEPTLVALRSTPTPKPTLAHTATSEVPPATWTPEPSRTPIPVPTTRPPRATRTPRPTVYFTPFPTMTGTPEPTRHPYPFKLVDEGVEFTRYPFSSDCNWLGIAGEVVDQEGEPVNGIAVVLNGGGLQNVVTTSGDRPDYAPSGWEHFLDTKVKDGDFTIQLYRVANNQSYPVSEVVDVHTRRDCRANLAYLIFEVAWDDYIP